MSGFGFQADFLLCTSEIPGCALVSPYLPTPNAAADPCLWSLFAPLQQRGRFQPDPGQCGHGGCWPGVQCGGLPSLPAHFVSLPDGSWQGKEWGCLQAAQIGWEATRFAFGRLNSAFPGPPLLQLGSALARLCCTRARPFPGHAPLPELRSLLAHVSAQAPKRQILEAV